MGDVACLVSLPIRLALGGIMVAHGAQKVLGSFGGPGFKAVINIPKAPFSFMRPAWLWWGAAALSEFIGGILIVLGFLTRVGAFFVACFTDHGRLRRTLASSSSRREVSNILGSDHDVDFTR